MQDGKRIDPTEVYALPAETVSEAKVNITDHMIDEAMKAPFFVEVTSGDYKTLVNLNFVEMIITNPEGGSWIVFQSGKLTVKEEAHDILNRVPSESNLKRAS